MDVAMAVWRRRALVQFPELRGELNPPRPNEYNYYSLFFDLYPMYRRALNAGDEQTLSRIFDFAEWCFHQGPRKRDLNNAVCVCFYEHVFDVKRRDWPDVSRRLSPVIVEACWTLWERRHCDSDVEELREILSFYKRQS